MSAPATLLPEAPGQRPSGAAPQPAVPGARHHARAGAGRSGAAARLVLSAGLPAADALALAAAVAVAVAAAGTGLLAAAGYAAVVLVILAAAGQHRLKITPRASDQVGIIFGAAAAGMLAMLPWLAAGTAWRLALLAAGLVAVTRAAAYGALRAARRRGLLTEAAVVVGAGQIGTQLAGLLCEHPELGVRPAGFLDSQPPASGPPLPVLGRVADLAGVVGRHRIRRVIVAFPAAADTGLVPALRAARSLPADVSVVPRLHEVGTRVPRASADEVWGIPLIPLRRPGAAARLGKRAFDVAAALALLALFGPVAIAAGVATRLQLRRPALFRQLRVTGHGRTAEIIKLRTLAAWGDPDTSWVVPRQRATRFGRLLRATHADELPQLLNVLRGEMSLVGPRPERSHFARQFELEIPGYGDRHRVTAGLTGWAQVHGLHGNTSIHDRARFDNAYIENRSFWLDLVILARTAAEAVAGPLAARHGRAGASSPSLSVHISTPGGNS